MLTVKFATKNTKLKSYRNEVWDYIEIFYAFSINWTKRSNNILVDFMANLAVKHNDIPLDDITQVEIKARPFVPDNVKSWQAFDDDKDLLRFLFCEDQYADHQIDWNGLVEDKDGIETILGQEVL